MGHRHRQGGDAPAWCHGMCGLACPGANARRGGLGGDRGYGLQDEDRLPVQQPRPPLGSQAGKATWTGAQNRPALQGRGRKLLPAAPSASLPAVRYQIPEEGDLFFGEIGQGCADGAAIEATQRHPRTQFLPAAGAVHLDAHGRFDGSTLCHSGGCEPPCGR